MHRRQPGSWGLIAGIATIAGLAVACSASATPSLSQQQVATPASSFDVPSIAVPTTARSPIIPTDPPIVSPAPTQTSEPTAEPDPSQDPEEVLPTPGPTAKPITAAGWTGVRVGGSANCWTVSAGIDTASRRHVAASCDGTIDYFASDAAGSWTRSVLGHPAGRADLYPQIALWGDVVYVAFQRIAPDGACGGSPGVDIGAYFRRRSLPNGAWSDATRIGSAGDHLESFRVDHNAVHATVLSSVGRFYEILMGTTFHSYPIPGATGPTSMRIGSDGRARIAYAAHGGLRVATFTGSAFVSSPISGSIKSDVRYDKDPVLVLDGGNNAHIVWTRYEAGACGEQAVGEYYATNASGAWRSHLITRDVGEASLQVDATGRVDVLVAAGSGLQFYTAPSSAAATAGQWTRTRVISTPGTSPVLRVDPATGALLIVYLDEGRIYVLIKA